MWKEVSHTADIAYEIEFSDEEELFKDIIEVLRKNADFVVHEDVKGVGYELSKDISDSLFDIVNDMIFQIDTGWIPEDVKVEDGKVLVRYKAASVMSFPIKALTYHGMNLEETKDGKSKIKVVFDV